MFSNCSRNEKALEENGSFPIQGSENIEFFLYRLTNIFA